MNTYQTQLTREARDLALRLPRCTTLAPEDRKRIAAVLHDCADEIEKPLPQEVRELVAAAQAGIKVGYALNPQSPTWPKLAVAIAAVEALLTPKEAKTNG